MDRISYGKGHLYQGVLILHQSYHGDYVYPCGRVAMSDGDATASNTKVPTIRCVWEAAAVSCHVRH
jgi:hypothetical protein